MSVKSSTLLALTASALALPGLSQNANADAPPAASTLSYRVTSYQEDDMAAANMLFGSKERYNITVNQLQWSAPVHDNYSVALTASRDSMSGASPWYSLGQPDGSAKIVMSGATIREERTDVTASGRRYLDNGSIGASIGYSTENDYTAWSGGFDIEHHYNDNLTTLAGGIGFSNDDINPTDAVRLARILNAGKHDRSAFVALTQVISANALVQTGLSYSHLTGYLTDPYKLFDKRPDSRSEWAWTTAWRQFVPAMNGALHADYRYYHDTFGVESHTVNLQWYQNLGKQWQLVPGIRYYAQSAADFFHPGSIFTILPTLQTSDYRLSSYGAISTSLKAQYTVDKFTLSLSGERYNSRESMGLSGDSSPGLVDFTRWTLGVDYRY